MWSSTLRRQVSRHFLHHTPRREGLPRLRPRRHSGRAHEASQEDQGHSTHGDRGHQLPDPDFKHHGSVVAFAAFPDDCSFFVMRATLPMAFIEAAIVARREGFATLVLRRALRKPRRRGEARIRARAYPQRGQGVHDSKGVERFDAFDDCPGYPACGIGTGLGDVVTNAF